MDIALAALLLLSGILLFGFALSGILCWRDNRKYEESLKKHIDINPNSKYLIEVYTVVRDEDKRSYRPSEQEADHLD